MRDLSIIIPVYNEVQAVRKVVQEVQRQCPEAEVIVVEDGSTDGSGDVLSEFKIKLVHHKSNRGYGAAVKTGIRSATRAKVILFDSDGQHRPEDILKIYDALSGHDMVIGVRSSSSHVDQTRWFGKCVLGVFVNLLVGKRVQDFNSGLRGFHTNIIHQYLHLLPDGFSASTTSTVIFYKRGYNIGCTPITTLKRTGKSTVRQLPDGLKIILLITRLFVLFSPLRLIVPLSSGFIIFGVAWGGWYFLRGLGLSVGALFFLLTGIMIFFFAILIDQISQLRLERFEYNHVRDRRDLQP